MGLGDEEFSFKWGIHGCEREVTWDRKIYEETDNPTHKSKSIM